MNGRVPGCARPSSSASSPSRSVESRWSDSRPSLTPRLSTRSERADFGRNTHGSEASLAVARTVRRSFPRIVTARLPRDLFRFDVHREVLRRRAGERRRAPVGGVARTGRLRGDRSGRSGLRVSSEIPRGDVRCPCLPSGDGAVRRRLPCRPLDVASSYRRARREGYGSLRRYAAAPLSARGRRASSRVCPGAWSRRDLYERPPHVGGRPALSLEADHRRSTVDRAGEVVCPLP